jgi:hypothetical protein
MNIWDEIMGMCKCGFEIHIVVLYSICINKDRETGGDYIIEV